MCQCTPEIRTPYCGKGNCVWPHSKPDNIRTHDDTVENAAREFLCALDNALEMDKQSTWSGVHLEKSSDRHKAWINVHEARAKLEKFL